MNVFIIISLGFIFLGVLWYLIISNNEEAN